jgi:hypothetical protein
VISGNRRLIEDVLYRIRLMELDRLGAGPGEEARADQPAEHR